MTVLTDTPPFLLADGHETVVARGVRHQLPAAPAHDAPAAVSAFFATADEGALLAGALPFDHADAAHLFQPSDVVRAPDADAPWRRAPLGSDARWQVAAEPSRAEYARNVADALTLLGASDDAPLRKVVLARRLVLRADAPIDVDAVIARLHADPSATTFCVPLPTGDDGVDRAFVGATPEILLQRTGTRVISRPLAGSARRQSDPTADRAAAAALTRSAKDRHEHAVVVESVADLLAPYCRQLRVPAEPSLMSTASMWHLATALEGELRGDGASSVELALALHPTPAVCGLPRQPARAAIARLEPFDRGFYTGAIGWCDARGDGRWMVAIRCAEIAGSVARLYAGAGIVAASDPAAEAAETASKFTPMLRALGIDLDRLQLGEDVR